MKEKTYQAINQRIESGEALVLTAEEMFDYVDRHGEAHAYETVDVVTTGTFGAMCSSGAFLNFGHSDPPIKMGRVWLNDVLAYAGIAAVDVYIGAAEISETQGMAYGGAHVIEDLLRGKPIRLQAKGPGTDCYPSREVDTYVTLSDLNQAYMFNPRNAYQNYSVAVNSSNETIHTYMGTLLPRFANATYSSAGQLSPLLNDPFYETIGVGTRIFLGGGVGYVAWEGTQHNPSVDRNEHGVPTANAGTIAVIGDLKSMDPRYVRAASIQNYGTSLYVGIGVPIPIVSRDLVRRTAVRDRDITAPVLDYSIGQRSRPTLANVSYEQLRSGQITLDNGQTVATAPLSSYQRAREIALELKEWIAAGDFQVTAPVHPLPDKQGVRPLTIRKEGAAIV